MAFLTLSVLIQVLFVFYDIMVQVYATKHSILNHYTTLFCRYKFTLASKHKTFV